MLLSIHIKNLYLIDDITIEFGNGLNILTGETGAGKSIILGALGLVLGDKADSSSVRNGYKKGIVEAVFDITSIPNIKKILDSKGITIDDDNILIIKREISVDGKSKAFVNMSSVIISLLKEIGEFLVDISGQHQHHSLLKVSNHLRLLDGYMNNQKEVDSFAKLWKEYHNINNHLSKLIEEDSEKEKVRELSQFAIDEIESAQLKSGEEDELEEELKYLNNYQKIVNATDTCYNILYQQSKAVIPSTEVVISELETISSLDINMTRVLEETKEALYKLESVKDYVRGYRDSMEFSPEKIDEINERLDEIKTIQKKYGGSIEEVFKYREKCLDNIQQIEKNEIEIKELEKKRSDLEKKITDQAFTISRNRMKSAKELEQKIMKELAYLGMEKTIFKVEFKYIENTDSFLKVKNRGVKIDEKGIDRVEFLISPNIGESAKPLAKIASGGELSRIMLAIKSILIDTSLIGTIVFDEVDVGIGGETSRKVGNKIKNISKKTMIICITHSPQIAAKGDNNYLVEKKVDGDRTITYVRKIEGDAKIGEIARMLAGEQITDITLQQARELITKE